MQQVLALRRELAAYSERLSRRPHVLLCNKADGPLPLRHTAAAYRKLRLAFPESPAFAISAKQRENLEVVLYYLKKRLHGDLGQ